jgi:hypothetical protein
MLILDSTSKTITAVMSGAPATTQPSYVVAWADNNGTVFTEGSSDGLLNGTTAVTIIASPAASTRRVIKSIYIQNTDTAAVTITIGFFNGSSTRTISKVTLNPNDTWTTEGTFDANGLLKSGLGGVASIANGGTGASTKATAFNALSPMSAAGDTIYGGASGTGTSLPIGTAGQVLTVNSGATAPQWSTPTTGTVTSVAATVPSFLSVSGSPITSSGTLAIGLSGTALPIANGGTGSTTLAGANIALINTTNSFSDTQTFTGSVTSFGLSLTNSNEKAVIQTGLAPTSTTNFYLNSGAVQYYPSNATTNWTLNIAFNSAGGTLNGALAVGQSATFVVITTQGGTAYYNSAVTIDGTSVTPKWVGGAPTAGNASGLDVYRYAVIKTASTPTYIVLASLTQYK